VAKIDKNVHIVVMARLVKTGCQWPRHAQWRL